MKFNGLKGFRNLFPTGCSAGSRKKGLVRAGGRCTQDLSEAVECILSGLDRACFFQAHRLKLVLRQLTLNPKGFGLGA